MRPDLFTLTGRKWTIEDMPGLQVQSEADGMCLKAEQRVLVSTEQHNPEYAAEVLVHEILHAAWHHGNLSEVVSDDKDEEVVVSVLGTVLTDLIVKNPKLITYIQRLYAGKEGGE